MDMAYSTNTTSTMRQRRSGFCRDLDPILDTQRMTMRRRDKSPVVSLVKCSDFFVLQREATRLDRAKRGIVAGIEVDQRLLYRRFQRLLSQTQLRQAQMDDDRSLVRELRKERLSGMEGRATLRRHSEWNELEKVFRAIHLRDPDCDLGVRSGGSHPSSDSMRQHSSAPQSAWMSRKSSMKSSTAALDHSTTTPVELKTVRSTPVALFNDRNARQVKTNRETLDREQELEVDNTKVQQLEAFSGTSASNGQSFAIRRHTTAFATPPRLIQRRPSFFSHCPSSCATEEDTKNEKLPLIELQLKRVRAATDDCLRRVYGFYAKLEQCSYGSAFDYHAKGLSREATVKDSATDLTTPFANNRQAKI